MDILINGIKLDYALEHERNLAEVLKSLEGWLLGRGGIINSVSVDRMAVPLDFRLEAFQKDVSSVHEVRIVALSRIELALGTMATVGEYIQKVMEEYLRSYCIIYHEAILEGLFLIHDGIDSALQTLKVNDLVVLNDRGRNMRELLMELESMRVVFTKRYIEKEDAERITALLKELCGFLQKAAVWGMMKHSDLFKDSNNMGASFNRVVLNDSGVLLRQSLGWCQSIAGSLQIGKDRAAFRDLSRLTEVLEEVLGVLQWFFNDKRVEGISADEAQQSLMGLCRELSYRLKKIEDSFIINDMVSVSDVIEYEMMHLVQELINLIEKAGNILQ